MSLVQNFPFIIQRLTKEESACALKFVKEGSVKYYFRVGPQGYFFSDVFEGLLPKIYNLELRPDDVFVIGFPRSGSTLTRELLWLVANDFDFDKANTVLIKDRSAFIEFPVLYQNDIAKNLVRKACETDKSKMEVAAKYNMLDNDGPHDIPASNMRSPRVMKTHLPFTILPPNILEKTKVVYVARDPRDVAVSFYHLLRASPVTGFLGEFKDFWELFKKDMVLWSPFFGHFREAWAMRDHPNMLFVQYGDLLKDLPDVIRRVAKFLGKTATEDNVARLCEHLKFENFSFNEMVNAQYLKELGLFEKNDNFIRKGKGGGWRDYFDEEMAKDAQQWMKEGLQGIDF